MDIFQHTFHFLFCFGSDDTRPVTFAIQLYWRWRIHICNAALINQVNNQLYFMQTFKIGHFRGIAGLDQRFIASFNQLDQTAT